MKPSRSNIGTTLSVALLVLIGSATASQVMAADRVCELITAAEAGTAVGTTVPEGTSSAGESGDRMCRYVAARQGMLAVTLAEDHGKEKYAKAKAKMQGDPALKPESISGLGDEAVFANVSRGISEMLVLKGDKSIGIALSGRTADSSKEALKELARKALSRL